MEITCKHCNSRFRAAVQEPLAHPVRVVCPSCGKGMVLRPNNEAALVRKKVAVLADEPRDFRSFLVHELEAMGFEVFVFETGEPALEKVRDTRAELVILNVYLKGRLGVEISEEIKGDPSLATTKVVLIGALFRANRFRANPTNLYGADEYIEEQIPAEQLRRVIHKVLPDVASAPGEEPDAREYEEARRLARLILSDIVIYNAEKVDRGIREGSFFELLKTEIDDGRAYYESKIPHRIRQRTEFFTETLQQFIRMKREELGESRTGTESQ